VPLDRLEARLRQLRSAVRHVDAVDLAGVLQPSQVLRQAEDRRPGGRLVAADPLEDRRPELHGQTEHVHCRITPWDQLTVAPDPLRFLDGSHAASCTFMDSAPGCEGIRGARYQSG